MYGAISHKKKWDIRIADKKFDDVMLKTFFLEVINI